MSKATLVTRAAVVQEARSWGGTPWRHQGRNRQGIDCIGLGVVVTHALGLSDYDSFAYGREPKYAEFLPHFVKAGAVRIGTKDGKDGDIILFHQLGFPCHMGFLATRRGVRTVIHAHMGRRMVVEEDVRPEAPIVAVFHLPGVEV